MNVTAQNYPHVRNAFEAIECDNGGHLIGRVYPGDPIDFGAFNVPDAWAHLIAGADAALAKLSKEDFETFACGDQDEADEMERRSSGLSEARILLNAYFDGWPADEAPFRKSGAPSTKSDGEKSV